MSSDLLDEADSTLEPERNPEERWKAARLFCWHAAAVREEDAAGRNGYDPLMLILPGNQSPPLPEDA